MYIHVHVRNEHANHVMHMYIVLMQIPANFITGGLVHTHPSGKVYTSYKKSKHLLGVNGIYAASSISFAQVRGLLSKDILLLMECLVQLIAHVHAPGEKYMWRSTKYYKQAPGTYMYIQVSPCGFMYAQVDNFIKQARNVHMYTLIMYYVFGQKY